MAGDGLRPFYCPNYARLFVGAACALVCAPRGLASGRQQCDYGDKGEVQVIEITVASPLTKERSGRITPFSNPLSV